MENTSIKKDKAVEAKKEEIKLESHERFVPWTFRRQKGRNGSPSFFMLENQFRNGKGTSLTISVNITQDEVDLINLLADNVLANIQPGSQRKVSIKTSFYYYETENTDPMKKNIYSLSVDILGVVHKYIKFNYTQNLNVNASMFKGKENKDFIYDMPFKKTTQKELLSLVGDFAVSDNE